MSLSVTRSYLHHVKQKHYTHILRDVNQLWIRIISFTLFSFLLLWFWNIMYNGREFIRIEMKWNWMNPRKYRAPHNTLRCIIFGLHSVFNLFTCSLVTFNKWIVIKTVYLMGSNFFLNSKWMEVQFSYSSLDVFWKCSMLCRKFPISSKPWF